MIGLALLSILLLPAALGQFFPASDGVNDLFAVLTDCNIRPRYPANNEIACYRTDARNVFGVTVCSPRLARRRRAIVAAQTANYTIYFLNTPGRLRNRQYPNRLLCRWNMRCPSGQLMYLDVVEHDIEPPVVSPFFRGPVCLDYLRISRDFGNERTCGRVFPTEGLEPSRLVVEFRSNRRGRYPGFRLRIVCFNPIQQDSQGCTLLGSNTRLRRNALPKVSHIFRKATAQSYIPQRFVQKPIPSDALVLYGRDEVTVTANQSTLLWFPNVNTFQTYNDFDGVNSFSNEKKTLNFRGFGLLTVINSTAHYVIYGVENARFMPNAQEKTAIRTLLDAEEAVAAEDDFIIPEEEPVPTLGNTPVDHGWKRTVRQTSRPFPPSVVNTARGLQNACNAVLRSVAESILSMSSRK